MNNNKNKALTFIFSLIPGAGHMYIGLIKRGVSLMGIFCAVIILLSWLSAGALALILPVLWFYSFFDLWNKVALTSEQFSHVRDRFLFIPDDTADTRSFLHSHAKGIGIVTILFGVYLLWKEVIYNCILNVFSNNEFLSDIIWSVSRGVPSAIVGIVIIIIGVRLIINKKKELDGGDRQ